MWSDELDKKMRETTEGSHPAYDERAWTKMEQLLDRHLPQKRRRRFIPLLLLPLALVGTGIFFAVQRQSENRITTENVKTNQPVTSGVEVQNGKEINAKSIAPLPEDITQNTEQSELKGAGSSGTSGTLSTPGVKRQTVIGQKKINDHKIGPQQANQPGELALAKVHDQTPNDQQKDVKEQRAVITNNSTSTTLTSAADKSNAEKTPDKEKKDGDQAPVEDPLKKAPSKTNHSRGSNFAIIFSTGPDFSSIDFNEPGQWRMQYGVGVLYSLSKKISLRTGFYVGRKIYTADPDDYQSNYTPQPSLQKIEANCLVYEIPINVLYNFPKRNKHNWFVGGGLSSYLMKEETYEYMHKYSNGQVHYNTVEYKNENAHFFSVANLSAGYQYHFSDRFSLMAEPYVKIPLSGVGQGKVQLNSGGILFTGAIKPFFRKN